MGKGKILIVDDEYSFCKTLRTFLEKLGHEVIVATNGEHALDIIKADSPEIMTLDIRMPGMDGYEVLNRAKRLDPKLVIIVITAIDVPRMEELLEHSGAHALIRKPIDLQELLRAIEKFLGQRGVAA